MSSGTFSSPLFVRRAAHTVQEIASPTDALNNGQKIAETGTTKPPSGRALMHITDENPVSAARNAFVLCETGRHIGRCNLHDAMARCLHVGQWKSASIGVVSRV